MYPITRKPPSRQEWAFWESVAAPYALCDYDILNLLSNLFKPLVYLSTSEIQSLWVDLLQSVRSGDVPGAVDLYVHMPFCCDRCLGCGQSRFLPSGRPQLAKYLKAVVLQSKCFADTFDGVVLRHLYVGGGNPGLLAPGQIASLFDAVRSRYRFQPSSVCTFEFYPQELTEEKLRVCVEQGVNRIALKIRSTDSGVSDQSGLRPQSRSSVTRAIQMAKEIGFPMGVTADLLLGLPGETASTFLETFKTAAAAEPERILIQTVLPSQDFLDRFHAGDVGNFRRALERHFASASDSFPALFKRFGYDLESALPQEWRLVLRSRSKQPRGNVGYEEFPRLPSSILGLGPGARSRIWARADYSDVTREIEDFGPSKKVFAAAPLDRADELVRFVLLSLREKGEISGEEFRAVFRRSFESVFGGAALELRRRGLATEHRGGLRLAAGSSRDRLLCCLCLMGKEKVDKQLDRLAWDHAAIGGTRIDQAIPYEKPVFKNRTMMAPGHRYARAAESYGHMKDFALFLGAECDNRCSFCLVGNLINLPLPRPLPWIPLERAKDEVAHFYRAGCRSFTFLGGEPTLYPHILEIAEFARALGYGRIIMNSNGIKYSDRGFLDAMIKSGFTDFETSLHSHREELETRLTGCREGFRKKVQGLRWLAEQHRAGRIGNKVSVTPVISSLNLGSMCDYVEYCHRIGVRIIEFKNIWPRHLVERSRKMIPRHGRVADEILKVIALNERTFRMDMEFADIPPCVLKSARVPSSDDAIHALAKKYFALDSALSLVLGVNGRHYGFQELKANILKVAGKRCEGCYYYTKCDGVWRSYAALHGLDELVPIAPPMRPREALDKALPAIRSRPKD